MLLQSPSTWTSHVGDQMRHLGSKYAVQERLGTRRVLILGLGGVGSNCALGLAMLGIGGLALVDFDAIEVQNLNRQVLYDTVVDRPAQGAGGFRQAAELRSARAVSTGLGAARPRPRSGNAASRLEAG